MTAPTKELKNEKLEKLYEASMKALNLSMMNAEDGFALLTMKEHGIIVSTLYDIRHYALVLEQQNAEFRKENKNLIDVVRMYIRISTDRKTGDEDIDMLSREKVEKILIKHGLKEGPND